ncbi:MAG: hypothetical protein OEM02_17385, partial [Desulfobulbaceae bacterium]|nr:hypothetical protein [Desulfobulbaceae bacterium]
MLFKRQSVNSNSSQREKIIANSIIDSVITMGYTCSAVSRFDLASGIDYLLDTSRNKALPWLSMNLSEAQHDVLPFKPYIIKEVGGIKIAILGLTDDLNKSLKNQLTGYKIKKWEDTLPAVLEEIKDRTDMTILLSNYPYKNNEKIAQQFNNIHLIIQSGSNNANIPPRLINNTLITQTMSKGKYLGKMSINWTPSQKWGRGKISLLNTAQSKLREINWQIKTMANIHPASRLTTNKRYQLLLKEKEQTTLKAEQLSKEMEQVDPNEA